MERALSEREPAPLLRAYHWTDVSSIKFIENGLHGSSPGLLPRREISLLDKFGNLISLGPFLFCLQNSPCPPVWAEDSLFAIILDPYRIKNGALALLSFDVFESDDPQIADCWLTKTYHGRKRTYEDGNRWQADYLESIIPLREYSGGYRLPELLLPRPIAFNRLTLEPIPEYLGSAVNLLK